MLDSTVGLVDKPSILESILIKLKLEPLVPVINEICLGLSTYNLLEILKKHSDEMLPIFCDSKKFTWSYDDFTSALAPEFSTDGSNQKTMEIATYKAFLDLLEYSFNAENAAPSAEIIQYMTSAPSIPVLERFDKIPVKFLHGCKPSENGTPMFSHFKHL